MAPENAPSLVILDAYVKNGHLGGSCEYIEPRIPGTRLRVRWAVESQPDDFVPVGGGVAYIYSKGAEFDSFPISKDAVPVDLGENRYRWTEGLNVGIPWVMFILILPADCTLLHPAPEPAGARIFQNRLALYWVLRGDDLGRTQVSWTLSPLRVDPRTELVHVNQLLSREATPQTALLAVEDASKIPTSVATLPTERAMAKKHVFLSYCRDNTDEVARLREELIAAGETVWWDKDILPGQDWKREIRKAMKEAYAVVLCLSKELATRINSGVYPEVRDAIGAYRQYAPGSIFLIPVRLSDCEIPEIEIDDIKTLDRLQHIDLFPVKKLADGIKKLLEGVKAAPHHPLAGAQELSRTAPASQRFSALPSRRTPASELPDLRPDIVPVGFTRLPNLPVLGLEIANDGEPAYDLTIPEVKLGTSVITFEAHCPRLTKVDPHVFWRVLIKSDAGSFTTGDYLRDEMLRQGVREMDVDVQYRDRDRWYATICKFATNPTVRGTGGITVRKVDQKIIVPPRQEKGV